MRGRKILYVTPLRIGLLNLWRYFMLVTKWIIFTSTTTILINFYSSLSNKISSSILPIFYLTCQFSASSWAISSRTVGDQYIYFLHSFSARYSGALTNNWLKIHLWSDSRLPSWMIKCWSMNLAFHITYPKYWNSVIKFFGIIMFLFKVLHSPFSHFTTMQDTASKQTK